MKTKRIPLPLASLSALDALYATLPRLSCKKLCQNVCGLIEMSDLEYQRIHNRIGRDLPSYDQSLTCPCLNQKTGLCKVHEIRPIICRLWGLVHKMACPWGCQPERWLSDDEARGYFKAVHEISAQANIKVDSGYRLK